MEPDSVLLQRSKKAQLEVALLYLKRKHGELQRQLTAAERQSRSGTATAELVARLRSSVGDHAAQVERHALQIQELEDQIQAAQFQVVRTGAESLSAENEAVTAELGEVRRLILDGLRQLAEPLRRYEALAEQKSRVTGELSTKTGRSQAYIDYIEGALFRQSEYIDEVRYVVDSLRRHRVVA